MYIYVYMYMSACICVCMVTCMNSSMQNNSFLTPVAHWFLSLNGKIDPGCRVDTVSFFYTLSTVITQNTRPVN